MGQAHVAPALLAVAASTALLIDRPSDRPDGEVFSTREKFYMATTIGGLLLSLIPYSVGVKYERAAKDDRATAFALYNRGLRVRLGLCVVGLRSRDCDNVSGSPAARSSIAEDPVMRASN